MDKKEIVKRSQAKRRARFKAQGLCVQCGKPANGKSLCPECMKKQGAYTKKYKERLKCTVLTETE